MKNVTLSGNITLREEGKAAAYQSEEVLKSKGHRLDMTDNTEKKNNKKAKQCDGEVELASPGMMTLTSQAGPALVLHTFFFFISTTAKDAAVAYCLQSQQNYGIWTRLTH